MKSKLGMRPLERRLDDDLLAGNAAGFSGHTWIGPWLIIIACTSTISLVIGVPIPPVYATLDARLRSRPSSRQAGILTRTTLSQVRSRSEPASSR